MLRHSKPQRKMCETRSFGKVLDSPVPQLALDCEKCIELARVEGKIDDEDDKVIRMIRI